MKGFEPAYPTTLKEPNQPDIDYPGVDMRDYFAARAMTLAQCRVEGSADLETVARCAYAIADAMLKARES